MGGFRDVLCGVGFFFWDRSFGRGDVYIRFYGVFFIEFLVVFNKGGKYFFLGYIVCFGVVLGVE